MACQPATLTAVSPSAGKPEPSPTSPWSSLPGLLRLAVVDVGGTTVIACARMNPSNIDEAFVAMFERILSTVRFR